MVPHALTYPSHLLALARRRDGCWRSLKVSASLSGIRNVFVCTVQASDGSATTPPTQRLGSMASKAQFSLFSSPTPLKMSGGGAGAFASQQTSYCWAVQQEDHNCKLMCSLADGCWSA